MSPTPSNSGALHVRKSVRTVSNNSNTIVAMNMDNSNNSTGRNDPLTVAAGNTESIPLRSTSVSNTGKAATITPTTTATPSMTSPLASSSTTAAASSSNVILSNSSNSTLNSHHLHQHHHHPTQHQQRTSLSMMTTSTHYHQHPWNLHSIQRWFDVRQMDIQSALDQMKTLLSTRPQTIYKTAYYRKQTKNHWYRDDPAFVVLQILFLLLSCIAYSIAFKISLIASIAFIFTSIVWNYAICGIIMASILRELTNRHLINHHTSTKHIQGQQVEWFYAFDIHCNSFFPVFVVLCTFYMLIVFVVFCLC
jgi:UNC-50 family